MTMACSTTAVQLTVNQWVAGSNPATPVTTYKYETSRKTGTTW